MALLKDNLIHLRAIEPEDLDYLYGWENNTEDWEWGNNFAPFSRFTIKEYIERSLTESPFEMQQVRLIIVLTESNTPVGCADIYDIDNINKRGALGLFIDPKHKGLGIGMRALNILVEYAQDRLFLNQVYAIIAKRNRPCVSLFNKSTFENVATLKDWIRCKGGFEDVYIYQKIFGED